MLDALRLIVSGIVSILLFEFLFYKLNLKFGLLESIRNNIEHLDEVKNKKLRVISFIFIVIIHMILTVKMSHIMRGILFGLFISFRDVCFKMTFLEMISNDSQN